MPLQLGTVSTGEVYFEGREAKEKLVAMPLQLGTVSTWFTDYM